MVAFVSRNKSIFILLLTLLSIVFIANIQAKESSVHGTFHTKHEIEALRKLTRAQPVGTNELFAASGLCGGCHGHDPNNFALIHPVTLEDINILDDWSATMMANSAKDPLWRAKVSHEITINPSHQIALEDKCTSCHAPQGRFNAHHMGASNYAIADMIGDSVALDGVSCGACHQIKDTLLGKRFSGTMIYDTTLTVYGPYGNPFAGPMQSFIGFNVEYGEHISKGALCGACHTLITETVDLAGNLTGDYFVEQATYHEWLNSSYSLMDKTCQKCHIPQIDEDVVIAANFQFLNPRHPFGKHHLVGGNSFMLKLMQDNISALGITAPPYLFDTTVNRTNRYLRDSTLDGSLVESARTSDTVFYDLSLVNKAGHKFPSGYPARIAYVEFVVMDALGDTLFKSGVTDSEFNIINRNSDYEPHYDMINDEQEVQIYEMVMGDVNDDPTTVLERAKSPLKDNRLTPLGFTTTHSAYDTTLIAGNALTDPDFNKNGVVEGTGADILHYHIPLGGYTGDLNTSVRVYYQSVPRRWLDEMFALNTTEIDAFRTMFNNADHTPALVEEILMGDIFTAGMQESEREKLIVYPNPTSVNFVTVGGIKFNEVEEYFIMDMSGKIVSYQKDIFWFNGKIFLPPSKGSYIIAVKTHKGWLKETVIHL